MSGMVPRTGEETLIDMSTTEDDCMDSMDLQSIVDRNMDIAVRDNGYTELASMSPENAAIDLCTYSQELENFDIDDVAACVSVWRASHKQLEDANPPIDMSMTEEDDIDTERYEATVTVAKPDEAVKSAKQWNLRATQATVGHSHDVTFEGNYGDLMNFMTAYLSMSSADADTYVDRVPDRQQESRQMTKPMNETMDDDMDEGSADDEKSPRGDEHEWLDLPDGKVSREDDDDFASGGGALAPHMSETMDDDDMDEAGPPPPPSTAPPTSTPPPTTTPPTKPSSTPPPSSTPSSTPPTPTPPIKTESTEFDLFMDRIVIDEARVRKVDLPENNPMRRLAKNYQERPMGRTRFVKRGT